MRRDKDRGCAGICGVSVSQQWLNSFFLHLPQIQLTLLLWFFLLYNFFSSCFYSGKKKEQQLKLFCSLSSHMTRTISFPLMPIKIATFKWYWRKTPSFPWRENTSRDLARDLEYPLNTGQDLSSLLMSNFRPFLDILGTEEVKGITSVSVTQQTSLKFPMNNLFSLTTDCQSIIYRIWSSVLSQHLPLSLYGLLQHYLP